jgi:Ca2+-binding EF-hand superfamily protein
MDLLAERLASKHRLPLHEVRRITKELANVSKAESGISPSDFRLWLCRIFDVETVDEHVYGEASKAALCGTQVDLNKFFSWYIQNMFSSVAHLTHASDRKASDALVASFAKRHGVSTFAIDVVKQAFDGFDADKNGGLDESEFQDMIHEMLRAARGDISDARLQRMWGEADIDRNGIIDFTEFATWYLKYFKGSGDGDNLKNSLLESLYDSYKPEWQRRIQSATRTR